PVRVERHRLHDETVRRVGARGVRQAPVPYHGEMVGDRADADTLVPGFFVLVVDVELEIANAGAHTAGQRVVKRLVRAAVLLDAAVQARSDARAFLVCARVGQILYGGLIPQARPEHLPHEGREAVDGEDRPSLGDTAGADARIPLVANQKLQTLD